jgi:hypothetical protein
VDRAGEVEGGGMSDHYILNADGEPEPCDLMTWAQWFETGKNRVAKLTEFDDGARVSTDFLGLDYSWDGPPVLWETMIFADGKPCDQWQDRYTSGADALLGHERAVRIVKGEEEP